MGATVSILIPRKDRGYEAAMQACEREISERHRENGRRCHKRRRRVHGWWFITGALLLAVLTFMLQLGRYQQLREFLIFATGATFTFAVYHLYKVDWHHRCIR